MEQSYLKVFVYGSWQPWYNLTISAHTCIALTEQGLGEVPLIHHKCLSSREFTYKTQIFNI